MPRQAKPFFHRGWWVTDLGGVRTKLARGRENKRAAEDAFLDLQQQLRQTGGKTYPQLTVLELCDRFLSAVEVEKSPCTYSDYRVWLSKFVALHQKERARDITRLQAVDFRDGMVRDGYAPKTVNNAIIALKACWNWGIRFDLLARNPFSNLPMLHVESRQRLLTDAEFRTLLRHTDALFRQVLLIFRQTPARPGDIRQLTWDQIDWQNHVWVIRRHKASRTARVPRPRVIPMTPAVEKLLRWRLRKYGRTERVFLNEDGRPWTTDALCLRMSRLRTRAGIGPDANGEEVVLYTNRHTYLTSAASNGVSGPLLAELAGHTDIRMTQRYVHAAYRDIYEAGQQATRRYSSGK